MKKTFLFLAIAAFAIQVNAQTHFSLHAGGAFPMGDFGAYSKTGKIAFINNGKEGGATMGVNIGLKAKFDIASIDGLGVIASGDIFFNGINSDFSEDMSKVYDEMFSGNYGYYGSSDDWEVSSPKYLNIPVLIGANYTYNTSDNIGLFAEAAVGVNFGKITDFSATYTDAKDSDEELVIKQNFDMTTSFAFQLGAGVLFNEKFSVGIHYYSLGNSKIKGKTTMEGANSFSSDSESEKLKAGKLSTGLLALRIGLHF